MNIRLFSVIMAGMLSVVGLSDESIAKPTSDDNTIGNGIKFTFQGCTYFPKEEKVVCLGNFRSSSGEQSLSVLRFTTNMTNTQGKTYPSSEFAIGADIDCKQNCNEKQAIFVEGVDYKLVVVFNDVSLPSSKIPLLSISIQNDSKRLKYRNIKVKNNESTDRSESSDDDRSSPKNSLTESPQPKGIDRPSTPQPTVNNSPRPTSPVTGIVENLVIRGLNDLFRIPNK